MTIFEYIKKKATKEEIAKMFTYLENDSGYYNKSNASVLTLLGKLDNLKISNYEDEEMYNLVINILENEIKDCKDKLDSCEVEKRGCKGCYYDK